MTGINRIKMNLQLSPPEQSTVPRYAFELLLQHADMQGLSEHEGYHYRSDNNASYGMIIVW